MPLVEVFVQAWVSLGPMAPLAFLFYIVVRVAPNTIEQISKTRAQQAQNRDTLTAGPLQLAQQGMRVMETQLESATKREERQAASDAAIREILSSLLREFDGFKQVLVDFNTDYHSRMSSVELKVDSVINYLKQLVEKGSGQ